MDFKDAIKQVSGRVEKLKENLQTEEATKNALIMPFIQALGYDVFNPLEVVPEYVCDIGTKKGEKIDYAIMRDGKPIILIECKHWKQDLTLHDNQLLRYFHVSNAKFGVLTNGIVYKFYTDLETANRMDEKPFLEVDITEIKNNEIEELKKFHKTYFDIENILSSANELKYTRELKEVINKEFTNPTPEFVKLIAKQVYDGIITPKLLEQFTVLVKKSATGLINDTISDRLKFALKAEISETENIPDATTENETAPSDGAESRIITTPEELEGFYIVKSILRQYIAIDRITYRDTISYFGILVDDNNRKPICRLYFNSDEHKRIAFIGEDKKETRHPIKALDDIYLYSEILIGAVSKYTNK
jgi:hypothetical protein